MRAAAPFLDEESFKQQLDEATRPSPKFLQAVQEIACAAGLAAEKIVAGTPVELNGITFWIAHHGALDPDGLVLMIHMGNIKPGFEALFRDLLEHNVKTPAAIGGYYGVVPGTDHVAFCMRLDLAQAPDPAEVVLAYVALLARQLQQALRALDTAADQLERDSAAAAVRRSA